MGLMFARRRTEDKKVRDANKSKAHAENHKAALENSKKPESKKSEVANGSDKPGAK